MTLIIGAQNSKQGSAQAKVGQAATGDSFIYEVTTAQFETDILKASMDRPVVIDFWAPWCGPCKQLKPMLEQQVASRQGKVVLALVNVDESPELAQAFRVQSVPMVVAMYKGQPVTGFAGARPQRDIEQMLDQLIALHNQNQPEALDIPLTLKEAAQALDQGDLGGAQGLYAAILSQDATQIEAYIGMVRVMIAAGDIEQAEAMIATAPEPLAKDTRFAAAKTALELAKNAQAAGDLEGLRKQLEMNPQNLDLKFDYAEACFAKGMKDEAVDALIAIIRADRAWVDEKAKKQLLKYFEAWGFADPASVSGRRKLSSVLFS